MNFHLSGYFKPYVRMTQRSKWSNPQAVEYIDSKMALRAMIGLQMREQGAEIFPPRTPLDVKIIIHPDTAHAHTCDIDNQIKALLDAMNDTVYPDDRWVDVIIAQRQEVRKEFETFVVVVKHETPA